MKTSFSDAEYDFKKKNDEGERDSEMHQTKKGNRYHFGMKAHIGVDAETGTVQVW